MVQGGLPPLRGSNRGSSGANEPPQEGRHRNRNPLSDSASLTKSLFLDELSVGRFSSSRTGRRRDCLAAHVPTTDGRAASPRRRGDSSLPQYRRSKNGGE